MIFIVTIYSTLREKKKKLAKQVFSAQIKYTYSWDSVQLSVSALSVNKYNFDFNHSRSGIVLANICFIFSCFYLKYKYLSIYPFDILIFYSMWSNSASNFSLALIKYGLPWDRWNHTFTTVTLQVLLWHHIRSMIDEEEKESFREDVRGHLHLNEGWVCQLAPGWCQKQMGGVWGYVWVWVRLWGCLF